MKRSLNPLTGDHANALLTGGLASLLGLGFVLSLGQGADESLAWVLLRVTGLISYLALSVTVVFGVLLGSRLAPAWLVRAQQYGWHGLLSGFALALGLVHGLFLTVGTHAQPLTAVFTPGASSFAPLAVGLGTVGLYALALVYASTLLRRTIGPRLWRALHLVAYPAFGLSTLHGVLVGSDHLGPLYLSACLCAALTLALRLGDLARLRQA